MKAITKNTFREIKHSKSRFLSIFLICVIGVSFFSGVRATCGDMKRSADKYYDKQNLFDLRAVSTFGLTEDDKRAVEEILPGDCVVTASKFTDIAVHKGDKEYLTRVYSALPDNINVPVIIEGRDIENDGECLISCNMLHESVQVGDKITLADLTEAEEFPLAHKEYTVVGRYNSPMYVSISQRGSTTIGDGSLDAFMIVPEDDFTQDVYTEIYVQSQTLRGMASYSEEYEEYRETLFTKLEELGKERSVIRYDEVLGEAKQEIADGEKDLAQAKIDGQKELDDAKQELRDGEKEIADGEKELADAKIELEDGKIQLDDAQKELADAKKELDDGRAELEENRKKLDDAKRELEDGEQELLDAKKELADAKKELDDAKKELDDAKKEIEDGERQLIDGKKKLEDSLKQLDDAQAEIDRNLAELESGWDSVNSGWDDLAEGEKQYNAGVQQLNALEQQVDQMAAALGESNPQVIQGRAAVAALRAKLEEAERELKNGRSELYDAEDQLIKGEEQLEEAQKEVDKGRGEYEKGLKEYEQSVIDLEKGKAEYADGLKKYEDGLAEYNDGYAEYEKGYAEYLDGVREYEDGLAEFNEGEQKLLDGEREYEDGLKTFNEKKAEYEQGVRDYENGLAEIEDARKKLAEGKADYEDGVLEFNEKIADAEKEIKDAKEKIADAGNAEWYIFTRDDNVGYSEYGSNAERISKIATIFPIFFLLVAGLVCLTTMSRMVEEQRTQIGTLKALGYSNGAVVRHYMAYAVSGALVGGTLGAFGGCVLFPWVIMYAYSIMYTITDFVFLFEPLNMLFSIGSMTAAIALTVFFSCRKALSETPASLMRPKAPKSGKRVFIEKIPFLWNKMNFFAKVSGRNLFRYKRRMFMTVIGIAGCTALSLTGFGLKDSISDIVNLQYLDINNYSGFVAYDKEASPSDIEEIYAMMDGYKPETEHTRAFIKQYETRFGDNYVQCNVTAVEEAEKFPDFVNLRERKSKEELSITSGAVITEKAAKLLGAQKGDTISLRVSDSVSKDVEIAGITEHYTSHYLYLSEDLFEELFGEKPEYNIIYFKNGISAEGMSSPEGRTRDADEFCEMMLKNDKVLTVSINAASMSQIYNTISILDLVTIVLIVSAGALALVVLYNLSSVNITERIREIATLKVLGFYDMEVSAYVFRENIVLTLMGAAVGLGLGTALCLFVIETAEIDEVMFGRSIHASSYLWAFLVTAAFSLLVNVIMSKTLKRVSMVESLKSVE